MMPLRGHFCTERPYYEASGQVLQQPLPFFERESYPRQRPQKRRFLRPLAGGFFEQTITLTRVVKPSGSFQQSKRDAIG